MMKDLTLTNDQTSSVIFDGLAKKNQGAKLYFCSMGKTFRIAGIASTREEANEFMRKKDKHVRQHGVIGETAEGLIIIAEFHGEKIVTRNSAHN